jgi:hypothetical protein
MINEMLTISVVQSLKTLQHMGHAMELLVSRTYPFIESESLVEHLARDSLFRMADGTFLLHLSTRDMPADDDRIIRLDCRTALLWINAPPEEFGLEWH